jgi:hypothetical protein
VSRIRAAYQRPPPGSVSSRVKSNRYARQACQS